MELKNTSMKLAALLAGAAMLTINLNAQNPETAPDDTWLTVSGTVTSVAPQAFGLDYGDGILTVEMDDWDADSDAFKVMTGDRVTVSGIVDDDLFEARTLEASTVYVQDMNTTFYASPADEEDSFMLIDYSDPIELSEMSLQGTVTDVDDEEFTLMVGNAPVNVEVEELAYDPLDDEGYQQIDIGDRVSVTGEMDYDFLEGSEFVAESVVTLSE